jgi:hypothetical protein
MGDTDKPSEKKPGEKKPGKYHYNPVNMSGKEAGIVEEVEEQIAEDKADQDEAERKRDPDSPDEKR